MNAFRRHWYSLGLIPAAVMAAWLVWKWNDIVWVQKLLALNFIVLILHQFEEYAWPGGFPWICNEVLSPKPDGPPDRYPSTRTMRHSSMCWVGCSTLYRCCSLA